MICQRCLLRAAKRNTASAAASRPFSHRPARGAQQVTAETTQATNPRPNDTPAATSTTAAQPFSEALTYSPERTTDLPIQREQTKQPLKVASSVPGGAVLKGLNFMKNQQDPIAMEDAEYPAWLWGVLEKRAESSSRGAAGKAEEGDLFSKSKKQRRAAAKALRRQQLLHPELLQPQVPLYEQSLDLPAGDGTVAGAVEAAQSRQTLTKAMRDKRRAKIKEDNFLKAMG